MVIKVSLKSIGGRRQAVEPVPYEIRGNPGTVRELILAAVEAEVAAYRKSLDEPELLAYLTKEEMDAKAQAGKISFGVNYGKKPADLARAQENAIQCFEDGIYRIFMDGKPLEELDGTISITQENVFTFVRLAMLAGRMW